MSPEKASTNVKRVDGVRSERTTTLPRVSFGGIRYNADGSMVFSMLSGSRNVGADGNVITALLHHDQGKIVAAGIAGTTEDRRERELRRRLWMEEDIVPIDLDPQTSLSPLEIAAYASRRISPNGIEVVDIDPRTREVRPLNLVTIKEYEATSPSEDFDMIAHFNERLGGTRVVHVTSTAQGGGVALMRHDEVRLAQVINEANENTPESYTMLNIGWHVTVPDIAVSVDPDRAGHDPFEVTKQVHNTIQGVSNKTLTDENEQRYDSWTRTNAEHLQEVLSQPDAVFVVEDPQPARLIKYIRDANPDAKIIYRSHIQIRADLATEPGTAQSAIWQFMRDNLVDNNGKGVDLFIAHPSRDGHIDEFVPQGPNGVDMDIVLYRTAATSPIDGLNKELSADQMEYYTDMFNTYLTEHEQTPLDPTRESLAQIARFDPSKNIPGVIETYRQLREKLKEAGVPDAQTPQLIIAGHGAKDDPDGVRLLEATMLLREDPLYAHLADDIKVARLPHNDQMLNMLARRSKVGMQISIAEGCEVKVTEWKMKGKPVIGSNRGGIPRQIKDGVDGYIFEPTDYSAMSDRLFHLFTDPALYAQMSAAAKENANTEYMTVANLRDWVGSAAMLKEGKDVKTMIRAQRESRGRNPFVKELLTTEYEKTKKQQRDGSGSVVEHPSVNYVSKETQIFPL